MSKLQSILRSKRTWTVLGTVLVLAAVIFIAAALSSPQSKRPGSSKLTDAERAALIAGSASDAMSRGETSTAVELTEQALALDPGNETARRVADEADGGSPENDPEPSAPETEPVVPPQSAGVYAAKVEDVKLLLPASMSGWTRGVVQTDATEAIVTFEPAAGNKATRTAVRVLVSAHDRSSEKAAADFIAKVSKRAYPVSGKTVSVGATPKAYVGTNGAGQATCAFARGRYAFDVIVAAQPGASDAALIAVAAQVAAQLPAAQ